MPERRRRYEQKRNAAAKKGDPLALAQIAVSPGQGLSFQGALSRIKK